MAADSIINRLRSSTGALHQQAETQPFLKALVSGALPQAHFVHWLSQLYLVHRSLERCLHRARKRSRPVASVVREWQYKQPHLQVDLARFGVEVRSIKPKPATQRVMQRITQAAATNSVALLGYHYVLEGSTNGGKIVAKLVQKNYGLEPGPGLCYLDAYGPEQRNRWREFVQNMEAIPLPQGDAEQIVASAKDAFLAVIDISSELWDSAKQDEAPSSLASPPSEIL